MELRKEDIENLFNLYNIKTHKHFSAELCDYINGFVRIIKKGTSNRRLELAEMLYYLRGLGPDIRMKGIIKNPRNGEVKLQERSTNLNIANIKDTLEFLLNSMLRIEYGMLIAVEIPYNESEYNFTETINKLKTGYYRSPSFLQLPYSDKELEFIISDSRKNKSIKDSYRKGVKWGVLCRNIELKLEESDSFLSVKKTGRYCLIYDIIMASGYKEERGEPYFYPTNKEKYDWVKHHIASFQNKSIPLGVDGAWFNIPPMDNDEIDTSK